MAHRCHFNFYRSIPAEVVIAAMNNTTSTMFRPDIQKKILQVQRLNQTRLKNGVYGRVVKAIMRVTHMLPDVLAELIDDYSMDGYMKAQLVHKHIIITDDHDF